MANYLTNNKGKLSLIIIIICGAAGWIDSRIENETSNLFQWLDFFFCLIWLLILNFSTFDDSADVEYDEPESPTYTPIDGFPIPVGSNRNSFLNFNQKPINMETNNKPANNVEPKTKAAPSVQTEDNNQEENIAPKAKTSDDMPKIEGIKGYSLHTIHKKWRPMYMDICSFATHAVPVEAELDAKVQKWGLTFKKVRAGESLVAYVIEHGWGNQRIPDAGFIEVK